MILNPAAPQESKPVSPTAWTSAGLQPFTEPWYKRHPQAWQWTADSDAWDGADEKQLADWVGAKPDGHFAHNRLSNRSPQDESHSDDRLQDQPDNNGQDVPWDSGRVGAARLLAQGGTPEEQVEPVEAWLSLGVFGVTPSNNGEPLRLLHLAVSRRGLIRGSYYDLLSETGSAVSGKLDVTSGRFAFDSEGKGALVEGFARDIVKVRAPVDVHFADERTQRWQLIRLQFER